MRLHFEAARAGLQLQAQLGRLLQCAGMLQLQAAEQRAAARGTGQLQTQLVDHQLPWQPGQAVEQHLRIIG
ncbi:hypothetical protein D3C85_1450820 [compost metagenome]